MDKYIVYTGKRAQGAVPALTPGKAYKIIEEDEPGLKSKVLIENDRGRNKWYRRDFFWPEPDIPRSQRTENAEQVPNPAPTDRYKFCNHHHELTPEHEVVDFGDGQFVANKAAIPLLRTLNEAGLRTRSHHIETPGQGWVAILLDNADVEIRTVNEIHADRTKYNGKKELLITWGHRPNILRETPVK